MILITGATGNVGSEVVRNLVRQKQRVRIATRSPHRHPWLGTDLVEAVALDIRKPETFAAALAGVDRMFLVRPPDISNIDRDMRPFLEAAKQMGIQYVAFLSLLGAERNSFMPHRKIEVLLAEIGFATTFLRASFFMQNLSTTHLDEIRDKGEIFVPAGHGRTSFIDVRDIGEIAAKALQDQTLWDRARDLTGSEALSYGEVAGILSEVLDKSIRYTNPSALRFVWRKYREGAPLGFALVMTAIYAVNKLGLAGRVSDDAERVLGRKPITLRQFAEDNRAVWLLDSGSL